MAIQTTALSLCFLAGLLAASVYFDARSHRIPNTLTLGGTLAGLVLATHTDPGWGTLALSTGGAALGAAMFLPLYALGKMGAGDVKMLGMVGAFLGPAGVFWAAMWSLIAGGALAVAWLIGARGLRRMTFRTLGTSLADRPVADGPVESDASPMQSKMPYAAAIAVGAIIAARLQVAA